MSPVQSEIAELEEQSQSTMALKFMRVWLKENGRWQIIAGSISR